MNGTGESVPPAHAHAYYAETAESEEHRHEIYGFTFPVNGRSTDGHIHSYQGLTEISRGHTHRYYGTTGPAIPLKDGSHYHTVSGTTNGILLQPAGAQLHDHSYSGASGAPIGTEPPDW